MDEGRLDIDVLLSTPVTVTMTMLCLAPAPAPALLHQGLCDPEGAAAPQGGNSFPSEQ